MWTRSKRRYVDGRQLEFFWLSTTTNHKNPEIRMHSVSRLHFWSQSVPYYPTFILCHSFHMSQTCDDPPRALEWIFDWHGLTHNFFLSSICRLYFWCRSAPYYPNFIFFHAFPYNYSRLVMIVQDPPSEFLNDLIVLALIQYALQARGGMLMNTAWVLSINNHKLQTCL